MRAMEEWTEREYWNTVLDTVGLRGWGQQDEISHGRNYHSALDRPLHGVRRWFHFSSTLGGQRPGAGYRQ
jgi:hypothetical protein